LLEELFLDFTVKVVEVDERVLVDEEPQAFVERVSFAKAKAVARNFAQSWVLAADTAVVVGGEILGKPKGPKEAVSMLHKLSGREHHVWTGFSLCNVGGGVEEQQAVRTVVCFEELDDQLCRAYVATGDPLDKAGGYGIQSMSGFMVRSIRGSYTNVVGLPVAEVLAALMKHGVISPCAYET